MPRLPSPQLSAALQRFVPAQQSPKEASAAPIQQAQLMLLVQSAGANATFFANDCNTYDSRVLARIRICIYRETNNKKHRGGQTEAEQEHDCATETETETETQTVLDPEL